MKLKLFWIIAIFFLLLLPKIKPTLALSIPSPNRPPTTPIIKGNTTSEVQANYMLTVSSMDFDGQDALTVMFVPKFLSVNDTFFHNEIQAIKAAGVIDAVMVDIPWKTVEPQENTFDFTLTNTRLKYIADQGLLIQVGINIALNEPAWFRNKYQDIDFVSEEGKRVRDYQTYCSKSGVSCLIDSDCGANGPCQPSTIEYPSFWHPQTKQTLSKVFNKYNSFLNSLDFKDKIILHYVNSGFWGEPHYPLILNYYTGKMKFYFWAYDAYAIADFRNDMKTKYSENLSSANSHWGTNFIDWNNVVPPKPGEFTVSYWSDFLDWYKSERDSFVTWVMTDYAKYTDRSFYSTGIGYKFTDQEWNEPINAKGLCTTNGCDNTQAYPNIKRMLDTSGLIPLFINDHHFINPADLPGNCLVPGYESLCFTGRIVNQIWGQNLPGIIIGESVGPGKPGDVASVVINYGLDGMRYVDTSGNTDINNKVFNSDGTPTSFFSGEIVPAFQRVKLYRQQSQYVDKIRYTVDWGDTTETTGYYTSGQKQTLNHTWAKSGNYSIRVLAEDSHQVKSFWAGAADPFVVNVLSMPTNTPTPSHCLPLGDLDCSGKVNILDLSNLNSKFGSVDFQADINGSNKVNMIDLSILLQNFGK